MGQYDFSYEVSDNLKKEIIKFLSLNESSDIADLFKVIEMSWEDKGLAYYAGLKGDNWNKRALDFIFEGTKKNIELIKAKENIVRNAIKKMLKPNRSGFLLRNIDYFVSDEIININLPKENGEDFEVLSKDIRDALDKNEPALVLDRLHTYTVKFFRDKCRNYDIPISNNGDYYPLHSLMGSLVKYYDKNKMFQSDFIIQSLKMSISLFDKYNDIRNNLSYAHDNSILNKSKAIYVIKLVTATITLINEVENL